jgi:hypothetical protein
MQSEAMVSNATKSTYQKKYKCPYCEGRFTRAKLHIHIQEKHEDLIPEGYTALRVAFNTINNKTEGHCIMCGNVTDWNEDKGRYERLCNDPKCHEAYKKMVAERTKKKYGTERLQTDPEYAEYVQRKALAGRKMHGEYTFADGGKIEYFGSYERKFLQFMDQVMHCESEDILAPAPSIKYQYEGKTHLYIPDFYYIPYNLIIEIKDGGSNPNNHPHRTGEDELKLRAKEEAIRQLNEFSYVRVVNNDFSQVLSIMAVLKYNMAHRYKDPVIKVNESMLLEANPVKVESMSGTIGSAIPLTPNPIPYECDKDNYYIIQHMQNNVFNYSITKDPVQYTMYSVDPEEHGFYKVFKTDKSKISKKYTTFKIKDKQTAKELYDELAMCEAYGKSFFAGEVSRDYIYRRLTEGSKLLSDDQIKYDTRFEQVQSFDEQIQDICEGVRSFILGDPVTRLEEQVSNLANLNTLHEASTSSSHDTVFSDDATTYVAKVKQAEEAEKNYGLVLIYPDNIVSNKGKEDIDRLKAKYNQYLALNQDKRTLSNRTAYNIFGYDNDTMYSRLLSKYMNSQDGYTSDNSNMVIAPIDQYYSPTDKIDYSSSDINVSHEEVVDETSWKRVISELCVRMKNTSDFRQKNAIKSEISMLGWNPEIPFNEEALERVRNSKHTMHIFREVDAEDYIKSIHSFNEATYEELKDKIVPVYIAYSVVKHYIVEQLNGILIQNGLMQQ